MRKSKKNLMKEASRKCGKLAEQLPMNLSDEDIESMLIEPEIRFSVIRWRRRRDRRG